MATPRLDLHFPNTYDLKTLGIVDISSYPSNFNIISPTIEITPPSFDKKNIVFHTNSLNIYNSNTLGLTCGTCNFTDLPDGIWTVIYSVSPVDKYFVERTFLRVDKIKARMEEVFMAIDIDECDRDVQYEKLKIVAQIEMYIEGAVAAANKCNNILAMKLYSIANRMITNLLNQC